ncbi:MAG: hypothetical protein K0R38_3382 [Polyangiaceae bacterium]|nr:hypothetical protein [Polyangiaceae bacterium]
MQDPESQAVPFAHALQLARLDEQPEHVHVARRIFDEPLHPFDDDQPRDWIPIEGVKEEDSARPEHSRHFGHDRSRVLHVLQEVHGAHDVERRVGEGQAKRVPEQVVGFTGGVVPRGDVQAGLGSVQPRHIEASVRQIVAQKPSPATDVQHPRGVPTLGQDALRYPRVSEPGFGAQERDGVIICSVPALAELVVDGVVDGNFEGFFHEKFQYTAW